MGSPHVPFIKLVTLRAVGGHNNEVRVTAGKALVEAPMHQQELALQQKQFLML